MLNINQCPLFQHRKRMWFLYVLQWPWGRWNLSQKAKNSQGTPILLGLEDGSSANISYCVYISMVQVKFKRCTMFGERVSGYKSSLDLFLAEKGIGWNPAQASNLGRDGGHQPARLEIARGSTVLRISEVLSKITPGICRKPKAFTWWLILWSFCGMRSWLSIIWPCRLISFIKNVDPGCQCCHIAIFISSLSWFILIYHVSVCYNMPITHHHHHHHRHRHHHHHPPHPFQNYHPYSKIDQYPRQLHILRWALGKPGSGVFQKSQQIPRV